MYPKYDSGLGLVFLVYHIRDDMYPKYDNLDLTEGLGRAMVS
jgi:hypothetical protein